MQFWIAAIVISVLVAGLLVAGVLRGRAAARAEPEDIRVYRDQLREVEKDVARGLLAPADAERLRLEISRRILDADRGKGRNAPVQKTPRGAVLGAAVVLPALVAASIGLYAVIGEPGYVDMPLSARHEAADQALANLLPQAEAEARFARPVAQQPVPPETQQIIQQMRDLMAQRPNELEGFRLLANAEASLGNFVEAYRAQARVIELMGESADAQEFVALAQLMIFAAGGHVSEQARIALEIALTMEPGNPWARYLGGLLMYQIGRPDRTFHDWRLLLNTSHPDAPWVPLIRQDIELMAGLAGIRYTLPPAGTMPAGFGPDAQQIADAADLSPEEAEAMIRSMVDGLAARLASDGGTAQEWAQLIQALGVLDEREQAAAIWAEAQMVFAADPAALETVLAAARGAGVAP